MAPDNRKVGKSSGRFFPNTVKLYSIRVLVGIAAGIGLCVGPIFLSEIAPSKIKGAVGSYESAPSVMLC